ncbi:Splicing factor U2AF subunit [Candida viswanathii]|uniref:Splicing factor U2AF subunit n=1 Tax=Candida viswanathii TaxID=5486 RepID=A0A367XRD0_9ASCO|nr:Splicing factor U2AF subunit [Candida viswanathii]
MSYTAQNGLPTRPPRYGDRNDLHNSYPNRENLVICSFYTKIGACRHGERCSKKHIRPNFSNTIMLANLYQNPKVKNNNEDLDTELERTTETEAAEETSATKKEPVGDVDDDEEEEEPTEEEIQEYFDQFYADVFVHISQMRPINKLSVCENKNDHLNGNVYVQFFSDEDASYMNRKLNSEWFNERPVYSELSPVADFEEAHCRAYDIGECDRGVRCNYMHVRQPSEELFDELFRCQQKSSFQRRLDSLRQIYGDSEANSSVPTNEDKNESSLETSALLEQLS